MNRYAHFIENMNNDVTVKNAVYINPINFGGIKTVKPRRNEYMTLTMHCYFTYEQASGEMTTELEFTTNDMQTAFEWLYTTK